jgi:hypothetical protein
MKKFIAVMVVLMGLMTACDMEYGTAEEIEIGNVYDYDFEGSEEIPEFETINNIRLYVWQSSNYVTDKILYNKIDYFATPEEFYKNKNQGDCEDFCIFFGYLLYKNLNIDSELIQIRTNIKNEFHIILYIPQIDKYIEPIWGTFFSHPEELNITKRIPFHQALWMALNYHDLL